MPVRKGIGVSPGIAIGHALVVGRHELRVPRYRVSPDEVPTELRRFWAARREAREQIKGLRDRAAASLGPKYAGIFDAHLMILEDRRLGRETVERVRGRLVNIEWALAATVARLLESLEAVDDAYLRERGNDISDVHERLQQILAGAGNRHDRELRLNEDTVVVAHVLNPSDAVWLHQDRIVGFVTESGGRTSHTAILANALQIPAVLGAEGVCDGVADGDEVIVDGAAGEVIVGPSAIVVESYRQQRDELRRMEVEYQPGPVVTEDGVELTVAGNIEFPEEIATLERVAAHGIGLYRSEFLFLATSPRLPSEAEHLEAYRLVARAALPGPLVIRTFDLGGDKSFSQFTEAGEEDNPVMGMRAVRYSLKRPDIFRQQIRALLRVAAETPRIWILVPMVSGVEEWRAVLRLVAGVRGELESAGEKIPAVPLGCMIEVPSAALVADHLAREADFLSIGSNDLMQYALAVDRGNSAVAYLNDPWHPALLRLVEMTIAAGQRAGIPVGFCGEMASDPLGALTLLGLGLRGYSCNPVMIPEIRELLRVGSSEEARAAVRRALELPTGQDVRAHLAASLGPRIARVPGLAAHFTLDTP
ncbi:MAG: phosphoenolpyruvate--protein phosphotransferase [Acidobacteria bacterium]|nr:phosphoenolpyruvate--protein phosphotransferase [Acidobacteriota bacterium]